MSYSAPVQGYSKDLSELFRAAPTNNPNLPCYVPGVTANIAAVQLRAPIIHTEALQIGITVSVTQGVIPRGSVVYIDDGNSEFYIDETVQLQNDVVVGSPAKFIVTLQLMGAAKKKGLSSLPLNIYCKISPQSGNQIYFTRAYGFELAIENFTVKQLNWKTPKLLPGEMANILVFGWVGAGKSTLINKIYEIFLETACKFAAVLNSVSHVSTKLDPIDLNVLANISVQFRFFDSMGLSKNNYMQQQFDIMMQGLAPDNYNFLKPEGDLNAAAAKILQNLQNAPSDNKIHSVIIVMPQGAREDQQAILRLRAFISYLVSERNMNPILVITRLDEVPADKKEYVRKLYYEQVGIDYDRIFFVNNDPRQQEKDPANARIIAGILEKALLLSDNFIRTCADYRNLRLRSESINIPAPYVESNTPSYSSSSQVSTFNSSVGSNNNNVSSYPPPVSSFSTVSNNQSQNLSSNSQTPSGFQNNNYQNQQTGFAVSGVSGFTNQPTQSVSAHPSGFSTVTSNSPVLNYGFQVDVNALSYLKGLGMSELEARHYLTQCNNDVNAAISAASKNR